MFLVFTTRFYARREGEISGSAMCPSASIVDDRDTVNHNNHNWTNTDLSCFFSTTPQSMNVSMMHRSSVSGLNLALPRSAIHTKYEVSGTFRKGTLLGYQFILLLILDDLAMTTANPCLANASASF
jgi:hypothetical protein